MNPPIFGEFRELFCHFSQNWCADASSDASSDAYLAACRPLNYGHITQYKKRSKK